MAYPLSALSQSQLNVKSPAIIARNSDFKHVISMESRKKAFDDGHENYFFDEPAQTTASSPFVSDPDSTSQSPTKHRSPNKHRSPMRTSSPAERRGRPLTEDALRVNDGLDNGGRTSRGARTDSYSEADNDTMSAIGGFKSHANADDTCFSTFSAVANTDMTTFARLGDSPARSGTSSPTKSVRQCDGQKTPEHGRPTTPCTMRQGDYTNAAILSSSPTPRHKNLFDSDDTTNLLDFTDQLGDIAPSFRTPHRTSPRKAHIQPDFSGYPSSHRLRSPTREGFLPASPAEARHLTNLLDFDLPPAPTPRSMPSVTARELESLKSTFLSQISSLKATLSGKEAEIASLKGAKDDAEQRVGKTLQQVRDLRDAQEDIQSEKGEWEKRDKEMQAVLRQVKEEIICSDKERETLLARAKDLEKRWEESEARACEAESKIAGLKAAGPASATVSAEAPREDISTPGSAPNKAVEIAVEKVARELHTLYKAKHETKVSALKKSYEARWEKRIRELQAKLDDVTRENDELRLGRDATMSGVIPAAAEVHAQPPSYGEVEEAQRREDLQLLLETKARCDSLTETMDALRKDSATLETNFEKLQMENARLKAELDTSRQENSDLVAAVEQMLSLESAAAPLPQPLQQPQLQHAVSSVGVAGEAGFRTSVTSRASGLKGPGFGTMGPSGGEGRFGMAAGGMKRSVSGGQGLGMRSGIMSNIERMGRGRGID
ncbi:hypothetical protein MMC13_005851 [Lambiella insularis]|nr:hypothetical protein [Lambiella insularis]